MNPSTQLRALEGEIAKFEAGGLKLPYTQTLLTIARDLELQIYVPDTDGDPTTETWREYAKNIERIAKQWLEEKESAEKERDSLRQERDSGLMKLHVLSLAGETLHEENATLKRRLDEAMKELNMVKVGFEITGPEKAVEYISTRITEIDKL